MSKKAKAAEAVALADAMVHELGSLRSQGDGAYPPRLRQLASRAGGSPAEGQPQAAAVKKAFTTKAVVTEKVGKAPSLDFARVPQRGRTSPALALFPDVGVERAGRPGGQHKAQRDQDLGHGVA